MDGGLCVACVHACVRVCVYVIHNADDAETNVLTMGIFRYDAHPQKDFLACRYTKRVSQDARSEMIGVDIFLVPFSQSFVFPPLPISFFRLSFPLQSWISHRPIPSYGV